MKFVFINLKFTVQYDSNISICHFRFVLVRGRLVNLSLGQTLPVSVNSVSDSIGAAIKLGKWVNIQKQCRCKSAHLLSTNFAVKSVVNLAIKISRTSFTRCTFYGKYFEQTLSWRESTFWQICPPNFLPTV